MTYVAVTFAYCNRTDCLARVEWKSGSEEPAGWFTVNIGGRRDDTAHYCGPEHLVAGVAEGIHVVGRGPVDFAYVATTVGLTPERAAIIQWAIQQSQAAEAAARASSNPIDIAKHRGMQHMADGTASFVADRGST